MPKRVRWASTSNNRASARPSQPSRKRSRNNKGSGKKGRSKGKPPTLPNPQGLVLRSASGKGKPFTGKAVGTTPLLLGTDANDFSDDDSWGQWQGPGSAAAQPQQSSWSQSWTALLRSRSPKAPLREAPRPLPSGSITAHQLTPDQLISAQLTPSAVYKWRYD